MAIVTLPLNIDFKHWSNQIIIDLPTLNIPLSSGFTNWQDWAFALLANNASLTKFPLPVKTIYSTDASWKDWAIVFVDILSTMENL